MASTNIPTLTGAEILWATLTGEGVTTVFGSSGWSNPSDL